MAGDNCTFTLRHAELTNSKGELFTAPLRSALATDRYICHAGMHNIEYAPEFVYHGFRYAELSIEGDFTGDISVVALQFYNDIDSGSLFRCGNSTVNDIYRIALHTERCNLHSIASDCPQRDERLGWMNDSTVRFMTMPYLFNTSNLFKKITSDIANEQDELGRITCTAPFVFGERPADPVCSAYLIAAIQHYHFTGSSNLIKTHYNNFIKWSEYLKTCEIDGIVDYSYYGDWAGPEPSCTTVTTIGNTDTEVLEGYEPGAAHSRYVPGKMISTGCHYMNFRLLAKFAEILSKPDDIARFNKEADRIQTAFLNKWCTNGKVYNGSQGCQAFALFIDILPESVRQEAADIMADAVHAAGCIQTGNITTAMLFDMLCKYGYVNLAWKLFSRTEYPSIGYMLANGATTIWERYELKEDCGMNSHNHPMHGATIGFLFRSLAGFTINEPNKSYALKPLLPEKLSFYELKIPLLYGEIYLKYEQKYGKQTLIVDVPFGLEIELSFGIETFLLSHGHHHAERSDEIWILTNY